MSLAERALDIVPNQRVANGIVENYHFDTLSQQEKFEYKLNPYYFIDEEVKDSLRTTFAEKGPEAAWNGLANILQRS